MSGEHANGQLFHRCIPWGYLFCRFASILALPIFESFTLLVLQWDEQILTHGVGWCTQAVCQSKQRAITASIWTIISWGEPTRHCIKVMSHSAFSLFLYPGSIHIFGPCIILGSGFLASCQQVWIPKWLKTLDISIKYAHFVVDLPTETTLGCMEPFWPTRHQAKGLPNRLRLSCSGDTLIKQNLPSIFKSFPPQQKIIHLSIWRISPSSKHFFKCVQFSC